MNVSTSVQVAVGDRIRARALAPQDCPPNSISLGFGYNAYLLCTTFEAEQIITALQGALADLAAANAAPFEDRVMIP